MAQARRSEADIESVLRTKQLGQHFSQARANYHHREARNLYTTMMKQGCSEPDIRAALEARQWGHLYDEVHRKVQLNHVATSAAALYARLVKAQLPEAEIKAAMEKQQWGSFYDRFREQDANNRDHTRATALFFDMAKARCPEAAIQAAFAAQRLERFFVGIQEHYRDVQAAHNARTLQVATAPVHTPSTSTPVTSTRQQPPLRRARTSLPRTDTVTVRRTVNAVRDRNVQRVNA